MHYTDVYYYQFLNPSAMFWHTVRCFKTDFATHNFCISKHAKRVSCSITMGRCIAWIRITTKNVNYGVQSLVDAVCGQGIWRIIYMHT